MRIIAGQYKGAIIAAPRGTRTRPTADRVREAIFSILGNIEGASVLDLFAGSGALGLEAISRGAASAELVDSRPAAAAAIARNIDKLGAAGAALKRRDYRAFLRDAAKKQRRFDLIFVDPPYKMHRVIEPELKKWLPPLLAAGGRLVIESAASQDVVLPLALLTDKVYGDTRIRVFQAS